MASLCYEPKGTGEEVMSLESRRAGAAWMGLHSLSCGPYKAAATLSVLRTIREDVL